MRLAEDLQVKGKRVLVRSDLLLAAEEHREGAVEQGGRHGYQSIVGTHAFSGLPW